MLSIRIAAIESLAQMKAIGTLAKVQALQHHEHPSVRRAVVLAMGELAGSDKQIDVAREMLADPDPSVRQAAAHLLIAHPSADLVASLVTQLGMGYPPLNATARNALIAAAKNQIPSATQAAAQLLGDPDPRRREDGSFILGAIGSDAALDQHIKLLQDADIGVVAQAARSLGQIGKADAGPALSKLAQRASVGDALQSISPAEAGAIGNAFVACGLIRERAALGLAKGLVPQKLTCPPVIRTRAIWAVGVLGTSDDKELADELLNVVRDNSPYEIEEARTEAIKAIGNLGYQGALAEFRKQGNESLLPRLRLTFHRVADRLAGTQTAYTPPNAELIADTSIQVLRR